MAEPLHMLCKADARRIPLADKCVQTCVTSPPYFGLRDYGTPGQIGLEPTPDEFVTALVAVFREVRRVLRDDGTCWLVIGDSYNAGRDGGHAGGPKQASLLRHNGIQRSGANVPSLKPKDLIGIPWRVAFALQADGWWLRQDIIWHKPNSMPESVTDRCTKAHEYIFLLTKRERYYYDNEAVKEQASYAGANSVRLNAGKMEQDSDPQRFRTRPSSRTCGYPDIRNLRSVWTVNPHPFPGAHFATFPPKLIEPCIKAGTSERGQCPACGSPWVRVTEREEIQYRPNSASNRGTSPSDREIIGGARRGAMGVKSSTLGWKPSCPCNAGGPVPQIVIDPFNGSGTTGSVATGLNRRYVGLDLSDAYLAMARQRIERPHAPVKRAAAEQDRPLLAMFD